MERQRKERLVGAAVLIMLAVIFIPMLLDDSVQPESGISGTNIPPGPEGEFESRVIPLTPAGDAPGAGSAAETAQAPASAPTASARSASAMVEETPTAEPAPAPTAAPAAAPPATPKANAEPVAGAPVGSVAPPQTAPAIAGATTATENGGQAVGVTAWVVQLGSFSSEENANSLNKKLRQSGYSAFVEPLQHGGAKVYRVRVGPELRRSGAQAVRNRLQANMGLDGIVVPYP